MDNYILNPFPARACHNPVVMGIIFIFLVFFLIIILMETTYLIIHKFNTVEKDSRDVTSI